MQKTSTTLRADDKLLHTTEIIAFSSLMESHIKAALKYSNRYYQEASQQNFTLWIIPTL